jgi:CP family cyanate transporter-like MFS transporter
MSDDAARAQTRTALVAIAATAFNLRIAVVAVGPLLSQIRADTHMGAVPAGVLGAVPFLCMGTFALLGRPLVQRLGERRLIHLSLLLIILGTLLRAAMPTAALVVITTVPAGIGIALIGLSLPSVIKRSFALRLGAVTGAYTAAQALGATAAAVSMVPLSHGLGGWRGAFAVSALPTLIAVPLWLLLPRRRERAPANGAEGSAPERRIGFRRPDRQALLLALIFGLQSTTYAGMINWLATVLEHNGWSAGRAGVATAVISVLMIPSALIIPAVSDGRDRARWLLGTALVMGLGVTGLAVLPRSAPWLWIVTFSVGAGALFPLVLTLPLDLGGTGRAVTDLTSSMLGYGYFLSAAGPLLVGALYDVTGGFLVPMALLGVLGMLSGMLSLAPRVRPRATSLPASAETLIRIG